MKHRADAETDEDALLEDTSEREGVEVKVRRFL